MDVRDATSRPVPVADPLTRPFWDACREGRLVVQECRRCAKRFFVPETVCPACLSDEWDWVDSVGVGTVYSFSVVHRPSHPAIPTPYVLAAVDLDDGWAILTNVVGCPPEDVTIGMRVRVAFEPLDDDAVLPCFTPAA